MTHPRPFAAATTRRPLAVATTLVALAVLMTLCPASSASPSPNPDGQDEAALALLSQASEAARDTAYHGTQFISTWTPSGTTTFIAEISHTPGQGTAIRLEGTSASAEREMFASDEGRAGGLAGPTGGTLSLLAASYDVRVNGAGVVAGRPARVVEALRTDRSVAARFWLDADTGLLLRRQVFDSTGRTVRASAYVDLDLGGPRTGAHRPAPLLPAPWTARVDEARLRAMRSAGWACPASLPSRLTLYDARTRESDHAGRVLHLSYSDGLSTVSVFQQRGHLGDPPRGYRRVKIDDAQVYVADGVPRRFVWSADGRVFTVLADAPDETVRAVVSSLPHEPDESGLLDRLGRGLSRVVSWLNPFD